MKTAYTAQRLRACLLAGGTLAALLTTTVARGQATNAASTPTDDEVVQLSTFEVNTEKDYGYLKTNSATATRIATNIQEVPLNISILGEDFIKDTNIRDIQDVLRYSSGSSGDNRMGIKPPGNSATPSGFMKLRGFPISQRLRNSVSRYTTYSVDNVDRVEIIKGPAAIFFGLGYPGGVINYVTKKPVFGKNFTNLSYGYGGSGDINGTQRATLDQNISLIKGVAAMRIVGAWDNMKGDQNFEYQKGYSITPSITILPFKNNVLKVTLEYEHTEFKRNIDDSSWLFNEQNFRDYRNPSDSLLTAAGISPTDPDKISKWQAKDSSYAQWSSFKRLELGNRRWAAYQNAERGAYYNDLNGNRVRDKKWNFYGSGSWGDQMEDALEATVDITPTKWMNIRYVYTREEGSYEALTATTTPNQDGNTFAYSNLGWRKDAKKINNHQLDLVFKATTWGIDHKILVGGLYNDARTLYYGNGPFIYNNIPGASLNYDSTKPANGTDNIPPWFNQYSWGLAFQPLKDRNGTPINSYKLFTNYDPAIHPMPDINRPTMTLRNIVDGGNPQRNEEYVNYVGDFFKKTLHLMGGYRWTEQKSNGGQQASANPPWYVGGPDMRDYIDPSLYNAYGIGSTTNTGTPPSLPVPSTTLGSYYLSSFQVDRGTSWMLGLSYDIVKPVTVYASRSQSFRPVSNTGALYDIGALATRAVSLGLDPVAQLTRIRAEGADTRFSPEKGLNTEFGVKTSLWDNKLVSTISVFQLDRTGEALDDTPRQQDEILNWTGPNRTGDYKPAPADGGVRWYSNSSKRRVEGVEIDVMWTPVRNFQVMASGSWLWKAKTILDTSISTQYIDPNTTDPALQAILDKRYYTYDFRMPGVPEWRFNLLPTYTFTSTALKKLRVGVGLRYTSVMNVQNSNLYDSKNGGLTAGDFVACDLNMSYPWELGGFKFETSLSVTNLFDSNYCEGGGDISTNGGFNFAPRRTWLLTTALKF